jgi:hypothetical protein
MLSFCIIYRVILRIFINRKGAMTFNVYHPPPILGHPFKVLERLLVFFLLEILKPIEIAEIKKIIAPLSQAEQGQ